MNGKNPDVTRPLADFIASRLRAKKLSANSASLLAGLDRDAIRNIKRGSQPSPDKLNKLAGALGVDAAELLQFLPGGNLYDVELTSENSVAPRRPIEHTSVPAFDAGPHDLRLMRQGGAVDQDATDIFVSVIPRPEVLAGRSRAYALYVPDNMNAPFLCAGQVVYIDPDRPIQEGRLVRIHLRAAPAILAILTSQNDHEVHVTLATEPTPRRYAAVNVVALERVVAVVMLEF